MTPVTEAIIKPDDNRAGGTDHITAEHLKYNGNSCSSYCLFVSLCLLHVRVPDSTFSKFLKEIENAVRTSCDLI